MPRARVVLTPRWSSKNLTEVGGVAVSARFIVENAVGRRRLYSARWEGAAPLRSRGVHLSPQPRQGYQFLQTDDQAVALEQNTIKGASFGCSRSHVLQHSTGK
jgi:hypothetical protein